MKNNKMKCTMLLSIAIVSWVMAAGPIRQSDARLAPKLLNYQGFLTDTLGNPITNSSLSLSFAIFDNSSSGNQKWTETQGAVSVDKGIFNVLLGSITPIPDSVFTNSTDRWLELTVGGQVLTPRTRIVSAGYAYTASYSDTAQYARNSTPDNDWNFLITDGADTTLQTGGQWGLARPGNVLYGNADSTHVNLGVACTTGISGQNYKYCTVGGGFLNVASGNRATVSGGYYNFASGNRAFVGGGVANAASNSYSAVAGGWYNTASGYGAHTGGGSNNASNGDYSVIGGGQYNTASDSCDFIGGGYYNHVASKYSSIPGGYADTIFAGADYAFLYGINSNLTQDSTFMVDIPHTRFGDEATGYEFPRQRGTDGQVMVTDASGQLSWATGSGGADNHWTYLISDGADTTLQMGGCWGLARAGNVLHGTADSTHVNLGVACTTGYSGANRKYCTVGGGLRNIATGDRATVGGGYRNIASTSDATVGGGYMNTVNASGATASGGWYNAASGLWSTVSGGRADSAWAIYGAALSGYHNLAGEYAADTAAIVVGGYNNTASAKYCFVGGGQNNSASGIYATVGGGYSNWASDDYVTVGGGWSNSASGIYATVGGGYSNWASDDYATVGGGWNNTASGLQSTVSGGVSNSADTSSATVGGGSSNSASAIYATVGGGNDNTASALGATVGGGQDNSASGIYATVGGGSVDSAKATYGGVGFGYSNLAGDVSTDTAAVIAGGFNNNATDKYSFVGGGLNNTSSAIYATVGGGSSNWASGTYATVGGGATDSAKATYGGVGFGYSNLAGDDAADTAAIVVGGYNNTASAKYGFAGGGLNNTSSAIYATVGGGSSNSASGIYATVGGGLQNNADYMYSTVAGGIYDTTNAVYGAVLGGYSNLAGNANYDTGSVVVGGFNNSALAKFGFVGGGRDNFASNYYASIGGGRADTATGQYSTISGGNVNAAGALYATVGGGNHNNADGNYTFVGGGNWNVASGVCAAVGGGSIDSAMANYSFATNYSTYVRSSDTNSVAFTTSHTTGINQVRAAAFSTGTVDYAMDHPDDPMNKILNQYGVSSDEVQSQYSGSVVLDASGRATVNLPDYFDDINRNPRIQLTGVGSPDVVYVAEKIKNNQFVVGGKPGMEVYWEVTAERTDIHAEIARIQTPVIQEKKGELRNHSIDDDAMIGMYDGLKQKNPELFKFKTEDGRRVHEQIKELLVEMERK